jgi:hypothetical protein
MTTHDERTQTPDADRLARSMLALLGHDDDEHPTGSRSKGNGTWSKAPDFAADSERAAAVREASERDRERYLTAGLTPVDCRFCHVTVAVKKLGAGHTAVQWSSEATQRCATFTEVRAAGGDSSRSRSCPKLGDSIRHAVAEGCLEEQCSAPSPGDG